MDSMLKLNVQKAKKSAASLRQEGRTGRKEHREWGESVLVEQCWHVMASSAIHPTLIQLFKEKSGLSVELFDSLGLSPALIDLLITLPMN